MSIMKCLNILGKNIKHCLHYWCAHRSKEEIAALDLKYLDTPGVENELNLVEERERGEFEK